MSTGVFFAYIYLIEYNNTRTFFLSSTDQPAARNFYPFQLTAVSPGDLFKYSRKM